MVLVVLVCAGLRNAVGAPQVVHAGHQQASPFPANPKRRYRLSRATVSFCQNQSGDGPESVGAVWMHSGEEKSKGGKKKRSKKRLSKSSLEASKW